MVKGGDQPAWLDVDIITGRFKACNSKDSLLLMRFYNKGRKMNQGKVNQLFSTIMTTLCQRNAYDVGRIGGSSGPPLANAEFIGFAGLDTSFPRQGPGVKFVKGTTTWQCAYIKVLEQDHLSPAFHAYGAPKRGGQFDVDQELMTTFPALYDFAETKVTGAYILDKLNQILDVPIQPTAVSYELQIYEQSLFIAPGMKWTSLSRKCRENKTRPRCEALVQFVAHNKHTLVCHPVGYHKDVFAQGKECLENKICFQASGRHSPRMGRGGLGQGRFVFAILDWANNDRGQLQRTLRASGVARKQRVTRRIVKKVYKHQPQLRGVVFDGVPSRKRKKYRGSHNKRKK